jgi:hypothetical protein
MVKSAEVWSGGTSVPKDDGSIQMCGVAVVIYLKVVIGGRCMDWWYTCAHPHKAQE